MTIRRRITPDDRVVLAFIPYRGHLSNEAGHELIRLDMELKEDFTHEAFDELTRTPGYSYDKGWFAPGRAQARLLAGADSISSLPVREQGDILFRLEFCTRFLKLQAKREASLSDASLKEVLPRIYAEILPLDAARNAVAAGKTKRKGSKKHAGRKMTVRECPGPGAFRLWFKRWRTSKFSPLALRSRTFRSGNHNPRIEPDVFVLIRKVACRVATEKRPSLRKLHRDLTAEIETLNAERRERGAAEALCPGRGALAKAAANLGAFVIMAGREGLDAARAHFAMVTTGPDVVRPLQRVEMDEWTTSLMKRSVDAGIWETLTPEEQAQIKPVRITLCVAECAATRVFLGVSARLTASSENALACLRMSVTDKSLIAHSNGALSPWDYHGTIEELYVDAGSSFIAEDFQMAAVAMGTAIEVGPSGLAKLRGRVERSLLTIRQGVLPYFTGQTFANVVDKGEYEPSKRVTAFVMDFTEALLRWFLDVYHHTPHEGLGGETPANAWKRLTVLFGVSPAPDGNKLRAIFGMTVRRTMGRRGLTFLGLHYQSEALQAYRRHAGDVPVDVKVDPYDLGAVSYWNGSAWVTVGCMRPELAGVTVRTWLATLKDLRLRFKDEAKITFPVVVAAMHAIETIARNAESRARIDVRPPTKEEVDKAERQLALGFTLPEPIGAEASVDREGDILAGAFPTTGAAVSRPVASAPTDGLGDPGPGVVRQSPRRTIKWER